MLVTDHISMELTYHYSPFFSGACYRKLSVNKTLFEKHVGDAGLLDLLELRLGLPGREASAIERILAYQSALGAVRKDAFYEKAFENDPLATAKEILRWRDLLVMEGFDAATDYESPRLKKLAEVEEHFREPGTPERWKEVRAHAKGPLAGVNIIVDHDIRLLPKLIRESLATIGVEKGIYDGLGEKKMELNPDGKDITIRYFGTVAEAYGWAADNSKDYDGAVICPDPFRMNAVLRNRELPLLEASAGGDSSITQLFRLGLSLLERPLNINNLIEYLRSEFSPIPGKHRYALANTLLREGGRGEEWEKALAKCRDDKDVQVFLLTLLDDLDNVGDEKNPEWMISAQKVTDWCKALAEWSTAVITEDRKPYQLELVSLCDGMCRVIGNMHSSKIRVKEMMKALKTLYELTPVNNTKATAGSWDAVDSHRCFIDYPEKLWWIPCNGGLGTPYPYSFMLKEERKSLGIHEMTDYIRYDFNRMEDLLGKAEEIVLFACDFDSTEALVEHPAVTVCKQAAPNAEKDMRRKSETGSGQAPVNSIFKKLGTIETGVDLYPKEENKDKKLSATSTETLIGFPFDFVMDKTLGFKDITSLRLSDVTPTLGTVAHLVFQRMLEDSGEKSVLEMKAMLETGFDKRVEDAAKAKGEILLLPENGTLLKNFKRTIRKSIGVLLDILQACNLKPLYSEEPLKETLDGFSDITGSVDFHAELPGDRIVVIDFKYSKGKSYIEKLEEDKAIQLELYAEGLDKKWNKTVVARAYYFFPINQLHTDDETGIFSDRVKGVVLHKKEKHDTPLSERIRNSKDFRQEQLVAGTLEIEEGTPLDRIEYHGKVKEKHLIDIPKADKKVNDEEVKASSPFANPTKYPILKNIIK